MLRDTRQINQIQETTHSRLRWCVTENKTDNKNNEKDAVTRNGETKYSDACQKIIQIRKKVKCDYRNRENEAMKRHQSLSRLNRQIPEKEKASKNNIKDDNRDIEDTTANRKRRLSRLQGRILEISTVAVNMQ